jgi:hypothetical protein
MMALIKKTIITLDFADGLLRWLTARGDQVRRWGTARLAPAEAAFDQADPEQLGAALAKVYKDESLPSGKVIVSIGGQRSIFRTLVLPVLEKPLMSAAVERKLRQEIPLPPQETELAWQVVSRDSEQCEVYVVATPRPEIDHLMQVMRVAGLRPAAMDVRPLALLRLVDRPSAIAVHLDGLALSIVVVVDGLPKIVRTVGLPSGLPSPESVLDLVAQELLRTSKFYNESHKSIPLAADCPLFLTGPDFGQEDFTRRMGARSPYPVASLEPALQFPRELSIPEYSVNLGLVLKSL